MTVKSIISYLARRGYKVTRCNGSVFVSNLYGYSDIKKFPSYNAAYKHFKS